MRACFRRSDLTIRGAVRGTESRTASDSCSAASSSTELRNASSVQVVELDQRPAAEVLHDQHLGLRDVLDRRASPGGSRRSPKDDSHRARMFRNATAPPPAGYSLPTAGIPAAVRRPTVRRSGRRVRNSDPSTS